MKDLKPTQEERWGWMSAVSALPCSQTSLISIPYLPRVFPFSLDSRKGSMLCTQLPAEPLASARWQDPPAPPEPLEAASRSCLPLHAGPSPHVMTRPHEGMACTREWTVGAWGHLGHRPLPRWSWVARQGWESGLQGMEGWLPTVLGLGGLFKALGVFS